MVLIPDEENSGISDNIKIAGFDVSKHAVNTFVKRYEKTNLDPDYDNGKAHTTSEILTAIELNRNSWGLYLKCIIALLGTNIMVGANLLPGAMEAGLIEYVNIWGILVVLLVAITVVKIEFIIDKHENYEYSNFLYILKANEIPVINYYIISIVNQ